MIRYLKEVYKTVEWHLYNYQQHKSEIEAALENLAYSRSTFVNEYIPNTGFVSNPVERAVIEYEKQYAKIEKWVKVIERAIDIVKNERNKKKYMLLIMRYFQGLKTSKILEELGIDEHEFYKWKDDIVGLVALLAVQEGLLKVKT